jgi:hypothetical protein
VDNNRINATAQEILAACLEAPDPVACLHEEIDKRRQFGQWTNMELYLLQTILLDQAKQVARDREIQKRISELD